MDDWKETKNTNIMAVYRQVNNVENGMISLEVKVILTDCLRMNKNNQWEASTLGGEKKNLSWGFCVLLWKQKIWDGSHSQTHNWRKLQWNESPQSMETKKTAAHIKTIKRYSFQSVLIQKLC